MRENANKGSLPIEGIDALALVFVGLFKEGGVLLAVEFGDIGSDQAIAATDIGIERAQRFAGGGGVQPESELSYFNGFGVDIHAVYVVRENGTDNLVLIEVCAVPRCVFVRKSPSDTLQPDD